MLKSLVSKWKSIPYKALLFGPWLVGFTGDWCNKLVMVVNGGTMPVRLPAQVLSGAVCTQEDMGPHDFVHACLKPVTHFKILADIWTNHQGVESLGDMLMSASEWLFWPALAIWVALMIKNHTTQKGS